MLQTSNLARKYTHICSFRKYIFQYQGPLNFSVNIFWLKQYLYSKEQYESCVRDFLVLFSVSVTCKVTIYENITFANSESGIRLPDCSKLAIYQKMTIASQICDMTSSSNFFDVVLFLLSILVTGPSFMSISSLVQEL